MRGAHRKSVTTMDRIIVPLDGSPLAEQALEMARYLAHALQSSLLLAHVVESPPVPGIAEPDREEAERYLAVVAQHIADVDTVPVATRVLFGPVAETLLSLAREQPRTMIVMSSHGRGGVSRLLFGSVSDQVIRRASVPVLIVRAPLISGDRMRHVLVPLDGSPLAEAALSLGMAIARATGATLGLVRVAEVYSLAPYAGLSGTVIPVNDDLLAEWTEQVRDEARAYLDAIVEEHRTPDTHIVWEVRVGRPAEEIIRAAQTTGADLIVMSTHGRGGLQRWAFGSVTDEVLRSRTVPVLVVPPGVRGEGASEWARAGTAPVEAA